MGGDSGAPEVAFMHSVLLPNTQRVLYWGYTREDQSRVWDYSTPAGSFRCRRTSPPTTRPSTPQSNMWSAEHTILDTPQGTVLIHGGFSPNKSFVFDPGSLSWTRVADTAEDRFYSTTLTLPKWDCSHPLWLWLEIDRALYTRRRLGGADSDAGGDESPPVLSLDVRLARWTAFSS